MPAVSHKSNVEMSAGREQRGIDCGGQPNLRSVLVYVFVSTCGMTSTWSVDNSLQGKQSMSVSAGEMHEDTYRLLRTLELHSHMFPSPWL